jgi:hypothetical protein
MFVIFMQIFLKLYSKELKLFESVRPDALLRIIPLESLTGQIVEHSGRMI